MPLVYKIDLSSIFPEEIYYIFDTLNVSGFSCYPVGGCVRDILLSKDIFDYDLTTNAKPEEIIKLFKRTIPTGIKHGTVTIIVNKKKFEITTYRIDGVYLDSRHPEKITFTDSLEEDLKRRDFTINALIYDISKNEILDFFDGFLDLKKKIIRTIGNPYDRFSEDSLRMLRAIRFSAQLDYEIHEETMSSILKLNKNIHLISKERIKDELIKIFKSKNTTFGIKYMKESGLMREILPEVYKMIGVEQNKHHLYDVYEHSIEVLKRIETDDYRLKMSAFLHDIGKPQTRKIHPEKKDFIFYGHEHIGYKIVKDMLKRLKFSNDDIHYITHLIRHHMIHYTKNWSDGAIRRFVRRIGKNYINSWFLLSKADNMGTGIKKDNENLNNFRKRVDLVLKENEAIEVKDLKINGNIIIKELKISPSKKIGVILHELLEQVIDNPKLNEREELIFLSKKIIKRLNS